LLALRSGVIGVELISLLRKHTMSFLTTNSRPWGWFEVLLDSSKCKVKRILVEAGKRLSLQRHQHREECWTIVQGKAIITNGERKPPMYCDYSLHTFPAEPGSTIYIPKNTIHRIEALDEDVLFIGVQLGDYFGEDNIERIEDDFRRIQP
jgi:mannose-6-phosphate isomerase